MKILIIGEYSGFIKNLTKGFNDISNFEIVAFAQSDGYKTIKQSVKCYSYTECTNFKIFGKDIKKTFLIKGIPSFFKFKNDIRKYKNYFDIIFIVNAEFLRPKYWIFQPLFSRHDIEYVRKNDSKVFLSACGFDYANILYMKKHASSIARHLSGKYMSKFYSRLNKIAYSISDAIVPVSYLYAQSYREFCNNVVLLKTIPLPFDATSVPYHKNIADHKIRIFNGVLRPWKGSEFTDKALRIIEKKYEGRIEIIYFRKPYDEFVRSLSNINIYIDQCGDSYGMAALVSMAAGCITFSANSPENNHELGVDDSPIVRMPYDVDEIVNKLSWWIEHSENFELMGEQSRKYVEKYHNPQTIAEAYIDLFNH